MSEMEFYARKKKKRRNEAKEAMYALSHNIAEATLGPKGEKKRLRASADGKHPGVESEQGRKKKRKKNKEKAPVEQDNSELSPRYDQEVIPDTPRAANGAISSARRHKHREEETKEERRERRTRKRLKNLARKEAQARQLVDVVMEDNEGQVSETAQPAETPEANDIASLIERIELDIQDPDDILRAVQSVHLRSSPQPKSTASQSSAPAPSRSPNTAPTIQTKKSLKVKATKRTVEIPEIQGNASYADLLANKFLKAGELAELTKQIGLKYKKGKFSAIEAEQTRIALERYQKDHGLSDEGLTQIILFKNRAGLDSSQRHDFWSSITRAVPQRPMVAVYNYVRRAYNPLSHQGHWSPEEDDALRQAVLNHGEKWEKVGEYVGRTGSDCRDRYRNYVKNKEKQANGPWSKEEEQELTQIVLCLMSEKEAEDGTDIFWTVVAEKMGHKRNRQQCRVKWQDELSVKQKNGGTKPRWTKKDSLILIEKVSSLDVNDDSEIQWNDLRDEGWKIHSSHIIGNKWLRLKQRVEGESLPFKDVVRLLQDKYLKGQSKFKSSELIPDEYLHEEEEEQ